MAVTPEAVVQGAEIAVLREEIEALSAIERPSASEGERRAAQWIDDHFRELGLRSRIEVERAHGTYWLPIGLAAALGAVGGLAGLRGRRGLGAVLGGIGAAGMWGDLTVSHRFIRAPLPKRNTYNVVGELGPEDAVRTVVLMGHHDSAHAGLIFHPEIPNALHRLFPRAVERTNTSPPLLWPTVGAPAAVALGSLTGWRGLVKAGMAVCALGGAMMIDVGMRSSVPGANDNASGVAALFGVARTLRKDPPAGTRVIFLSCGSEESFEEGSGAFGKRHFPLLPKESTFFICLDGVGSPHLLCLEGEGMLRMYEYPEDLKRLVNSVAAELGVEMWEGMRLRNSTDGLVPLRAGYPTATIASCTDLKQPINYHWPNDTPDCITYETVAGAVRLTSEVVRRLPAH